MTTLPAPPTILSPLPPDAPTYDSISLLPFSIGFDGPAPISSFFKPTLQPRAAAFHTNATHASTNQETSSALATTAVEHWEASFRGRKLVSTRLDLPTGYRGVVYATTKPIAAPISRNDARLPAAAKRQKIGSQAAGAGAAGRLFVDPAEQAEKEKAEAVSRGLRRSPRKTAPSKMVVKAKMLALQAKKFSLDSSDEENEQDEDEGYGQGQDGDDYLPEEKRPALQRHETDATLVEAEEAPAQDSAKSEDMVLEQEITEQDDDDHEVQEAVVLARDALHLKPVSTFRTIDVWQPDCVMSLDEDVYARTMREWCSGLGSKIHAY